MTPGTYLRSCREAAGLSRDDVALITDWTPAVSCRARAELLDGIEQDLVPVAAEIVTELRRAFAFDRHVLVQLIAIHAGGAIGAPQLCRRCTCSWTDPCAGDHGEGCAWAEPDLCTACVGAELPQAPPAPAADAGRAA